MRVAWPATILVASSVAYVFRDAYVPTWFAESDRQLIRNLLMACGWGAGAFRADIYVHVMNCSSLGTTGAAYDAKVSVKVVQA